MKITLQSIRRRLNDIANKKTFTTEDTVKMIAIQMELSAYMMSTSIEEKEFENFKMFLNKISNKIGNVGETPESN